MPIFVGLDCGGSSSRAVAVTEEGKTLFQDNAGPANLLSTPPDVLQESLRKATSGCPQPDYVCACFAGLVGGREREQANRALREVFPNTGSFRIEPDYAAALAACGPGTGACVIAGTGSVVCSRRESGWVKTGGRGPILGDPGSAARIGREAVSMFLDRPQSVGSDMRTAILATFGGEDEAGLIRALQLSAAPAAMLATMASAVGNDARLDADGARRIVDCEMQALAALLARHLDRYPSSENRVGLAGGLWKTDPIYKERFCHACDETCLAVELFVLERPPVEGAVELAKEMLVGH